MVALLLLVTLTGSGEPFTWEMPEQVESGETFNLTITCSEPGCSGLSAGDMEISQGLVYRGSSSSTSVATIVTPNGRELSQVMVYQLRFTATGTGTQYIGPVTIHALGIGSWELGPIEIQITGSATVQSPQGNQVSDTELVWLEGVLHDPGGMIYPGTRLVLDYYVYARIGVENVTYWWNAPELGVIRHVETIPDSNWEPADKGINANRSMLAVVEMTPAAAGSLYAPVFQAEVTGQDYDAWGKVYAWTLESDPMVLPVHPFPDDPPDCWDGTLLDSVQVMVEKLPCSPGQGGEQAFRVTCLGPGNIYMETPPDLTICGSSCIIPVESGTADNKRWWDFILEPEETGLHILGPDTLAWLDRTEGEYRLAVVEPCTLEVGVIPRSDIEIELESENRGVSSAVWILAVGSAAVILALFLGISAGRKARRMKSVSEASDLDELLSGLEKELSELLSGRRVYMGYEELDELMGERDVDSLLARRMLRFWRDLEMCLTGKEVSAQGFARLRKTAEELVNELRDDLKGNGDEA